MCIVFLAGCASSISAGETDETTRAIGSATTSEVAAPTSTSGEPSRDVPTTIEPSTTTTTATTVSPTTTSQAGPEPSATLPTSISGSSFSATIDDIDEVIGARLIHSWRDGCPVPLTALRLLTLTHWNFDGEDATGELVVHADYADGIVEVFSKLYEARFPIERMELVDVYGGDDDRSMAANNTSAFNCREVAWKPGVWSNHAFGSAIDINPLVNPYVSNTTVLPPEGAPFADRTIETLGGIYPGDATTEAFASIGWTWGGTWSSAKDWQHFSASGS